VYITLLWLTGFAAAWSTSWLQVGVPTMTTLSGSMARITGITSSA
jgi:hypothetical protein